MFDSGASQAAELPHLPDETTSLSNFIAVNYRDASGNPMSEVGYKIKFRDGVVITGKLDNDGNARHENVPTDPISVEYDERQPLKDKPWNPLEEMVSKAEEFFDR